MGKKKKKFSEKKNNKIKFNIFSVVTDEVVQNKFSAKCPIDFSPKGDPSDPEYGLKRITRHPMLFSLAFLSLGSALNTKYLSEICFFGFPFLFAFIGFIFIFIFFLLFIFFVFISLVDLIKIIDI